MSTMRDFLAQHYGNAGTQSNEQLEKQAQMEIFAKLAASNNIDLEKLSQEEIDYLWTETFKTAEEEPKPGKEEPKKEHLEDKAKEEHEKKKEAAAKVAESDFLGRRMAHAMVDELKKMAAAGDLAFMGGASEVEKAAAAELAEKTAKVPEFLTRGKELLTGSKAKAFKERARESLERAHKPGSPGASATAKKVNAAMEESKKVTHARIGAGAAGAAAVAGGAAAAHKSKEGSALDDLAAEQACIKAAAANFDFDEAADRIAAVLTLGVPESEKIASVQDLAGAVEIRSLELLELAGYPVTWAS